MPPSARLGLGRRSRRDRGDRGGLVLGRRRGVGDLAAPGRTFDRLRMSRWRVFFRLDSSERFAAAGAAAGGVSRVAIILACEIFSLEDILPFSQVNERVQS